MNMFGFGSNDGFKGVQDLPDLTGKVIIITGGTAGLGLSSAVALASKNATVIITARSEERAKCAIDFIKSQNGNSDNVLFGIMEQSDLKSVLDFVEWFKGLKKPLHVLMLNAGIAAVAPKLLDGIESQFYVNHLSHFLLVERLLPVLEASAPARIVFVSSDAHKFVKTIPDWKDIATNQYSDSMGAAFAQYGHSKLANIQTAIELSRRLAGKQIWCNSVHPGAVATDIGNKIPFASTFIGKGVLSMVNFFLNSSDKGALTQLYVAAHPDIQEKDKRGVYYVPTAKEQIPTEIALNLESQKALWNLSETLINQKLSSKQ